MLHLIPPSYMSFSKMEAFPMPSTLSYPLCSIAEAEQGLIRVNALSDHIAGERAF